MKFFHLSDLHIGKSVNGFSMLSEQRHAFNQIIRYINTEYPDAVVIAGDIYDRTVPSVEAVRLFDNFLTELADTNIAVMLISGNHDSPERLNYASRLLSDKRIYMCGMFEGKMQGVTLSDEHGKVNFWLLPFVKPSSVRGIFGGNRGRIEIESYGDAFAAALEGADIDWSERNVLVSHQFFVKAGFSPVRSESEMNSLGGLDSIDCSILEKFDYVALGHLHGAQKVGAGHIRYAGSPVKYSFSEMRHEKHISMVELNRKGSFNVTALPLIPLHDMREFKGSFDSLMANAASLTDKEQKDYIRIILTDEEEIFDPVGKIRSFYPNVMMLEFENLRAGIDVAKIASEYEQAEQLSPYELFGEFFLDVNGSVMSEEQAKIVMEVFEMGEKQ